MLVSIVFTGFSAVVMLTVIMVTTGFSMLLQTIDPVRLHIEVFFLFLYRLWFLFTFLK